MTTQTETTTPLPQHIGHNLAAAEFQAENPPLGHADYDNTVLELVEKIRSGEITPDEARASALDALVSSVFPTTR